MKNSDLEKFTKIYLNMIQEASDDKRKDEAYVYTKITTKRKDNKFKQKITDESDLKSYESVITSTINDIKEQINDQKGGRNLDTTFNVLKKSLKDFFADLENDCNIKKYINNDATNNKESKTVTATAEEGEKASAQK